MLTGNVQVDEKHLEFSGNPMREKLLDCEEHRQTFKKFTQPILKLLEQ